MEKDQAPPSSLKKRGWKARSPRIQNHGEKESIMSLGPTVAQKSPKHKGIPLLSMITASEKRWGDTLLHQRHKIFILVDQKCPSRSGGIKKGSNPLG